MKLLGLILSLMVLIACNSADSDLYPDDASQRPIPIYIVSHGWHTGIAVEKESISCLLPKDELIPDGHFLLFEWGDGRYFPHKDPGIGLLLRAAFLPTKSVLHVTALQNPPADVFRNSTVIRIQITRKGLQNLGKYIRDSFRYDTNQSVIFAANGLYPNSRFFEANQLYFFPRTSNKWTARALRETGFPITPFWANTSGNVIKQAKKDGVELP